jgi:hypothetical protein
MSKRGQVSMFLIIGLFILIIIILFFSFKDFVLSKISLGGTSSLNIEKQLESKMNVVSTKIVECSKNEGLKVIENISYNGGYLKLLDYESYYGHRMAVLCSKVKEDELCYNIVPSIKLIENEINGNLKTKIVECVNLKNYKTNDIDVKNYGLIVNSSIHGDNVFLNLYYPIIVSKDNQKLEKTDFNVNIIYPLGMFLTIAADVVGEESIKGDFSIGKYVIKNPGWIIDPRSVGTSRIYRITNMNQDKEFWFAVEK